MRKPIIGITSDSDFLQRNNKYSGLEIYYSQTVFSDAVFETGGIPYMIPMSAGAYADDILNIIDGLIIIGGHDVSPLNYLQEPREKLGVIKPQRDASDLALFEAAQELRKPILGVCRGHQLVNVALGGSLYQDLSENSEITIQHDQMAKPDQVVHSIKVNPESYMAKLIDENTLVNSVHHQIIDQLAATLKASAWSNDGVIEAFESHEEVPLIIGVQWHPEVLYQDYSQQLGIFEDLINRANFYYQ